MTKYNHTNESLKPHQQANTAGSDANLTAIERQDSRQVNCGENEGKNTVRFYPLVLFISALVSCVPAHAVSRSAFQTLLTSNCLYHTGNWKSLASPYLGTFSDPQNVNMEFLHTLGATASVRVIRIVKKNATSNDRQMKNPLTDVKSWGYDNLTTKYTAVKPNRHTLAIFVPIVHGYYPCTSIGTNARHINYDGLRKPNTKAFKVNKLRHLCMVVESRHPIFSGDNLLTKNTGGQDHA